LWQTAARHIESSVDCSSWFWWEAEAVPVKKGWLDQIWNSHKSKRKTFSGYYCLDDFMHGTAVWPKRITEATQSTAALYVTQFPFDKTASTATRKDLNKLNGIILSFKKAYGDGIDLGLDRKAVERWILNNPETHLLVDAFDADIRDIMLGRDPKKREPDDKFDFPSYNDQTEWESGMFTFPNLSNTCFFNPSVIELNGSKYLLPRRWRYNPKDPYSNEIGYGSDLVIWPIRKNMTLGNPPSVPSLPSKYPGEQWEDPRAVVHDGQIYVSFANWVYNKNWTIKQSFTRVSQQLDRVDVVAVPKYGGNSPIHGIGTGHEKNWTWFNRANRWHCVYSPNPQIVFNIDARGEVYRTWENKEKQVDWKFGMPWRGSTCPILIGEEYLSFFHSATQWRGPKRRYHMGACTFSSKPPFEILRYTKKPLLSGSDSDFRVMNSPLVIFPSGAVIDGDRILVTFGVNDEHCGWIKIPKAELDTLLQPI
jgi:predicted GH43/DUF377 family glycosyl hydrolase